MKFLRGRRGVATLEYIIIAALIVVILAPAFINLFNAISSKLQDIASNL